MAKWFVTRYQQAKIHVACAGLTPFLIRDLTSRGHPSEEIGPYPAKERCIRAHLDRGGPMFADRPKEKIYFNGLRLEMASEEVAYFLTELRARELRTFAPMPRGKIGRRYYKLHGQWCCLVMTPSQKVRLEALLAARLQAAEDRARVFYAERGTMGEVFKDKKVLADVDLHPSNRFAAKRGEA